MDKRIHTDVFEIPNNQDGVATKHTELVAVQLAKKYGVKLPKKKNVGNRFNLLKDKWKRDALTDFTSDSFILKCVLYNLSNYRISAETDKNDTFTSYNKLLKISYYRSVFQVSQRCKIVFR